MLHIEKSNNLYRSSDFNNKLKENQWGEVRSMLMILGNYSLKAEEMRLSWNQSRE
jgi:hypothetical protein